MEGAAALFKAAEISGIAILATVLVVLNVGLHSFKEWFSDRYKRRAEDEAIIEREIRPLVAATSDLVARLVELLVETGSRLQKTHWEPLREPATQEDLSEIHVDGLNRFHSTVIRLISFLALRERFRARTARILDKKLSHVRYFLERKIPPAFKGNIFGAEILSTEYAEVIGGYFLPEEKAEVTTLSTLEKLNTLKGRRLFNLLGTRIAANPAVILACVESNTIPDTEDAMRVLALAHFTIMAIDFYQNIDATAHWEEQRMVLCRFLAKYNRTREKACFLYERGDLTQDDDYLVTYGGFPLRGKSWPKRGRLRTWMVTRQLNRRAAENRLSHHSRQFSKNGLTLTLGGSTTSLKWAEELSTLMQYTNTFNLQIRRTVSVKPNITPSNIEKKGASSSNGAREQQ